MSQSILKRNVLEVFNRAINPNPNLNNSDNDLEYLFSTLPFPVYDVDWGPLADINRSQ